jgi:integrase
LEFTILTGVRGKESREAPVSEIDLAAKVWNIPAPRMKNEREHRAPLSPRALEIAAERLAEARNAAKVGDISTILLFPGTRRGRPIADVTMAALIRKLGHNVTTHGFRSTFRTWCGEQTNFPREIAEAALAHVNTNQVEAAYDRGDKFEKRRRLMDAWSRYAGSTPRAAEIVPIRQGRAL